MSKTNVSGPSLDGGGRTLLLLSPLSLQATILPNIGSSMLAGAEGKASRPSGYQVHVTSKEGLLFSLKGVSAASSASE